VSEIEIRAAGPADIPALAEFLCQVEREETGAATDRDQVAGELRALRPGPEFLLAIGAGGRIMGAAAFAMLWPSLGHGLSAMLYLKELHVAEPFRRQGVGKALMAGLARIARGRGCPRLGWTTPHENAAAQALYDGLGAQRAEWLLSYRLSGEALDQLAARAC
jgi:ribosomal protein S18 acetylase RimI-like enzyme